MERQHLSERIDANRIYLRKHELALAETMFRYVDQDRERLDQFMPWAKFVKTPEDERVYIQLTHDKWNQFELYDFGVFRRDDDVYMGNVGIHSISWINDRCEIGYWILGQFEGQGYMSEAVEALLGELFQRGFNRVEIRCSQLNQRSASIPRRLGFQLEACLEQHTLENGQYRDTLIFALLKSVYTSRQVEEKKS
jgi:hypothetical protein